MTTTAPLDTGKETSTLRPWTTFTALTGMAALTILDVSKVGVALPSIQASTGGSESSVQLMLVGYTIAYATFLLPSGRFGDLTSRRAVFLFGSTLFVLASLLSALSPNVHWLVVGRLLQGTGAGILMPQVLGILQRIFPAGERTKPLAIFAAALATTSTFGPVIAGSMMELVGSSESWRSLFWINVVLGTIVVPLAWLTISDPESRRQPGFDLRGILYLAPAVILTIAPLSTVSSETGIAPWMLACTVLGVLFTHQFVRHERRMQRALAQPLVDPQLFTIPHFSAGLAVSGLSYAAGTSSALVVTLTIQQYASQTALETALWMLPAAIAAIGGSWAVSRVPQARSYKLIATGVSTMAVCSMASAIAIATLPPSKLPVALSISLVANSLGGTMLSAPNQARTLLQVPDFRSSVAGSLIQFSQRIGSAVGLALALIVYYTLRTTEVPLTGQHALGPALAVLMCCMHMSVAALVAFRDRDPS